MQLEMTVIVRHIHRWGLEISAFVFRRARESIYILKRKLKIMLKPDMVNTIQSRWLLPLLFFTRPGNRLACPHLPKPVSVREQQEQAALQGRASREPWVAAGQVRTGTSPTGPHLTVDNSSDQGRSGDGDQG